MIWNAAISLEGFSYWATPLDSYFCVFYVDKYLSKYDLVVSKGNLYSATHSFVGSMIW